MNISIGIKNETDYYAAFAELFFDDVKNCINKLSNDSMLFSPLTELQAVLALPKALASVLPQDEGAHPKVHALIFLLLPKEQAAEAFLSQLTCGLLHVFCVDNLLA